MALPSGNFSSAFAGRLQVSFFGEWNWAGSDWQFGSADLILRGYVGSGGALRKVILSRTQTTGFIEVDYAGGSVDVPVGMEYISHSFSGPGSISASKLKITCVLVKR